MRSLLAMLLLAVLATPATAAGLRVSDGWVRALPPAVRTTAAYLVIDNTGAGDDVLESVCIDGVDTTEIHEVARAADGSMVMRHVGALPVPAGGRAVLAPGGLHLMLIGLQRPLQAGDRVRAMLHFRSAGDVEAVLEVRGPGAAGVQGSR